MVGKFHFKDIYKESYEYIDKHMIMPIIKEFSINYLVLDTSLLPDYNEFLVDENVSLELDHSVDEFKLFKICLKD